MFPSSTSRFVVLFRNRAVHPVRSPEFDYGPKAKDPAKHALILLLLFKPWRGGVGSLLERDDGTAYDSWERAFDGFLDDLHARLAGSSDNDAVSAWSPRFWARRILHVLQNIENLSLERVDVNKRAQRHNPEAALGIEGTVEVTALDDATRSAVLGSSGESSPRGSEDGSSS